MTTVNCMYCGIAGVHPGTKKCVDGEACDLRMALADEKALTAELLSQRDDLVDALEALYTFPDVTSNLAPKGSLGSIRDLVDSALARVKGGTR